MLLLSALWSAPLMAAEVQGTVSWGVPLTLSTSLEGEVLQVSARPGEQVKKGALLVQLDDEARRAQLLAARAEVAHQRLLLGEAKSELQRSEELYERTLLSDHDLDLARIALAAAESSYQRANSELVAAQRAVSQSRLVAPFEAMVLLRHVQAGEMVNGRMDAVPLYTLVAAEQRRVRLAVAPAQTGGVAPGDELALQLGARHYNGRVEAVIHYDENSTTPSVTIDIVFTPGKGEAVAIGDAVRVSLP
jgi:multidrug efflux system membrane fusion protein